MLILLRPSIPPRPRRTPASTVILIAALAALTATVAGLTGSTLARTGSAGAVLERASSVIFGDVQLHENFGSNLDRWEIPYPEDWAILAEGGIHFLHMKRSREPGVPRRPLQFALIKRDTVGSFDFHTRLRREGKSMIVVFNYVDTLHFYYTHLSGDRGADQPVHNGIFIVNGEPRKRIAGTEAPPALPDREWHTVRVLRDASKGSIEVFMDGKSDPLFSVQDSTFTCGQVGIGSFDETGDFADVELTSNDWCPRSPIRPASATGPR